MKFQKTIITISALALTALYTTAVFFIGYHSNRHTGLAEPPAQEAQPQRQAPEVQQTPAVSEPPAPAESAAAEEETYLLKEYNGQIAVYYNHADEPLEFLSIDYNSLRAYDKQLFQEGITVHTKEEIAQLEEDFSS